MLGGGGGDRARARAGERAHLSCRSKAAVRHGRSSSACSISAAVLVSTSDGRSAATSAVRGGLFQARSCGDRQGSSGRPQEAVRGP